MPWPAPPADRPAARPNTIRPWQEQRAPAEQCSQTVAGRKHNLLVVDNVSAPMSKNGQNHSATSEVCHDQTPSVSRPTIFSIATLTSNPRSKAQPAMWLWGLPASRSELAGPNSDERADKFAAAVPPESVQNSRQLSSHSWWWDEV